MADDADIWLASDLFVTVNTHCDPSPAFDEACLQAVVALNDLEVANQVFSSIDVRRARVRAAEVGFELTPRQGKRHLHFTLELDHSGSPPLSLGPRNDPDGVGVNERLQRYFDEALQLAPPQGCYVRADILREQSATKNYNRKQQLEGRRAVGRLFDDLVVIDR